MNLGCDWCVSYGPKCLHKTRRQEISIIITYSIINNHYYFNYARIYIAYIYTLEDVFCTYMQHKDIGY